MGMTLLSTIIEANGLLNWKKKNKTYKCQYANRKQQLVKRDRVWSTKIARVCAVRGTEAGTTEQLSGLNLRLDKQCSLVSLG